MSNWMGFLRAAGLAALLAAALSLPCTQALAQKSQKKIYTRSYRLQDFRSKTVKIVLDGPDAVCKALREDVTTFWTISPYEFCGPGEGSAPGAGSSDYFLRPEESRGIIYLTLNKGTVKPMKIVSVPVAGVDYHGSLTYMPAFLGIIQDYVDAAMNSEFKAYMGPGSTCRIRPPGRKVYKDPSEAEKVFRSGDPDAAVRVIITPDGSPSSRPRRTMVFGAANYELYSFR